MASHYCISFLAEVLNPLITTRGFFTLLIAYMVLCRSLRYRRRDAMHRKFDFPDRASLSKMTTDQAYEIMKYVSELEFPKLYSLSVHFGIFQTYGIPSLSKLLVSTRQLSSPEGPIGVRRYVETVILIKEFSTNPPSDPRVFAALARVNYMHTRHFKAGTLLNEDMLYTLRQFITMPFEFIEQYEWRALTDIERCAIATSWKWYGEALKIKYEGYLARSSWSNGLEWYDDLNNWANKYEETYMKPHEKNKHMYTITAPLLTKWFPGPLKQYVLPLFISLMPEILIKAMMIETPHWGYGKVSNIIIKIRQFVVRHLSLPRPDSWAVREVDQHKNGRSYMVFYDADPYYVKPGFFNRYGLWSWWVRLVGGKVPGKDFVPEGYAAPYLEVGPSFFRGNGKKEAAQMEEAMYASGIARGCPFAFNA